MFFDVSKIWDDDHYETVKELGRKWCDLGGHFQLVGDKNTPTPFKQRDNILPFNQKEITNYTLKMIEEKVRRVRGTINFNLNKYKIPI